MLQTLKKPRIKMKICTVGEEAVGKTSLVRRFVADKFDGEYIRTIGTLISKRTIELEGPMGEPCQVDAVIWDIMGRQGFMDLLKDAYFYKANAVLAVCDITRKDTLEALQGWLDGVYDVAATLPTSILANKSDLHERSEVTEEDVAELSETYNAIYFPTSAKTGENVFLAFESLIRNALGHHMGDTSRAVSDQGVLRARIDRP
ncbi:MAG: Rab family GTPase [Thermoplasmata archaeon]